MTRDRLMLAGCAALLFSLLGGGCARHPDMVRVDAWDSFRAGKYDESRKDFQYCIDKEPTDYKSHYYMGLIALRHFNEPAYARRHLEISYTIRKARPSTQLSVKPGSAETAVPTPTLMQIADALAEAIYRQDSPVQLAGFLREMTTDNGEVGDYLRLGHYLHKIGDPDAAREGFLMAMKLAKPGDAGPWIAMSDFYVDIGDRDQAYKYLRQAYWVKPGDSEVVKRVRAIGRIPGPSIALPPDEPAAAPLPTPIAPEPAAPAPVSPEPASPAPVSTPAPAAAE